MVQKVEQLLKKRQKKKVLLDEQLALLDSLLEQNERRSKIDAQATKVHDAVEELSAVTAGIVSVGDEDQKEEALAFSDKVNKEVQRFME